MFHLDRYRQPPSHLRFASLLALSGFCLPPVQAMTQTSPPEIRFNPGFMRQAADQTAVNAALALRDLAADQPLAPGRYRVEVRVNLAHAGHHTLEFKDANSRRGLVPCLSAEMLHSLGLRETSLGSLAPDPQQCVDLQNQVKGAQVSFDTSRLMLDLSIPQAYLRRDVAGSVTPDRWDKGIDAAYVNYQASAQHSSQREGRSRSQQDLYLNSGFNIAGWRLRSNQSLREDEHGQRRWTRSNTYAQTDLPGTWGTLTLGETFSNGEVFRSLPLKGVQLASDLGMLPDVLQNYAPVIRGIAQSRAKLEVLHNGYPIYSTYVAAGPYEIDDLGVAGGSGELEVVLTESDGQVRRFTQPYSTLSNLLRAGVWRYTAAAGYYNSADGRSGPPLWQGTLARGVGWNSTLYGGALGSNFYRANTVGIGRDFGSLGAVSLDATHARSDLGTSLGSVSGNSYAARYGKAFQTRTNLRFAGYRYSTEGYRDFDEAVAQRMADIRYQGNRRNRLEASAYQQLGQRSSVSLTFSHDDYWNSARQRRQYQLQFNTQHNKVSYNVFASQSLTRNGNDRMLGLSLTLPLDLGQASTATFDVQEHAGRYSQRASLNGAALANRMSYRAALANDAQQRKSLELSAAYQSAYTSLGAGYSESSDWRSLSVNASGALLVHAGGVTLGPYLGETNALVHVPGIPDVGVEHSPTSRTDSKGYLLAPHLRPYRVNSITLDTDQLSPETDISNGTTQAVPRRGAIVKTTFAARQVTRLLLTLRHPDGKPMRFGATVRDAQGTSLAVVGQGGQALIATHPSAQSLSVRWGERPDQQCLLPIDPSRMDSQQGYRLQTLTCSAS